MSYSICPLCHKSFADCKNPIQHSHAAHIAAKLALADAVLRYPFDLGMTKLLDAVRDAEAAMEEGK